MPIIAPAKARFAFLYVNILSNFFVFLAPWTARMTIGLPNDNPGQTSHAHRLASDRLSAGGFQKQCKYYKRIKKS